MFAQMMGDADDDHASLDFRVRLAHWIMTGKMMDTGQSAVSGLRSAHLAPQ